jgi:universal stress protein E
MQHFRNILVGIDLSNADREADLELAPPSQQALQRAIWLAAHTGGKLTIFTALDISPSAQAMLQDELSHGPEDIESAASEILERFVAQAHGEDIEAQQKLAFGRPWEEICRQVLAEGHDLVVVGTRDLGRVGRILFGSTGTKLLRFCPCPVWITRPDPNWEDLNILVPTDFSDVALQALRIAINGGQLVETRTHLLHALEGQIGPPAWFGKVQKQMVQDYIAQERAEATRRLHEQLALTDYRTLKHGVEIHVVEGPPEEAILKAVDDFQIDLLVMGTSARSGIASLVPGNTAERLASHLKCSVIGVKPPDFKCPIELGE